MRILFATLVAALLPASPALADAPSPTARAQMAKLAPMAGRWKGTAWMQRADGRHETDSEETIEPRLDGRALLVEGTHRDRRTGETIHHALAILSWDDARGEYRFLSTLASGRTGYFPARLEGDRFIWTIAVPNAPTTRYTITVDGDRWNEVGEHSRDGAAWVKFFEMNLTRVK